MRRLESSEDCLDFQPLTTQRGNLVSGARSASTRCGPVSRIVAWRPFLVLSLLLTAFVGLLYLLPLGTAIKMGADEDGELSKATLCNHGFKLYTEVWNDQPPLHTFIIANLLKHVSHSVLVPRLLTVGFAMVLLASTFLLIRAVSGLLPASLATAMLIGSPGFLELSSSAMREIPALAPIIVGLWLLWTGPRMRWRLTEILVGVLFGFALQMKFIGVVYLPICGLILWLRSRRLSLSQSRAPTSTLSAGRAGGTRASSVFAGKGRRDAGAPGTRAGQFWQASLVFAMSVIISFVALNCLTGSPLTLQLQQSWASHFAATKSFEYGSPKDYPYDWTVLLKNWDTTAPALLGLTLLLRRLRCTPEAALPIGWLVLTMVVFGAHRPWWPYYYIHNALPLCWCAGIGIAFAWDQIRINQSLSKSSRPARISGRRSSTRPQYQGLADQGLAELVPPGRGKEIWWRAAGIAIFGLCASGWMGTRIYLEEQATRGAPKLYTCLVLKEIERFKPFTTFMFSDQPIFSFHADLPMPPNLAVMPLKQLWTGELNRARLVAELETLKPGLIFLGKDSTAVPYEELLTREYRLVYQDGANRLYAHQSISKKRPL
jgi:hypothetical protein